jgi:hydroxymethylpyrimidine pyrophosphatase-like HAD family hydrolase
LTIEFETPRPVWMIVSDVDGTLLGDDHELAELLSALVDRIDVVLIPNSSRPIRSLWDSWRRVGIDPFPAQVGALGTEVELDGSATDWSQRFAEFDRRPIDRKLTGLGFHTNGAEFQSALKASYSIPRDRWEEATAAIDQIVPALVVTSGEADFDVIPIGAGKPAPLGYLREHFGVSPERMVAAGDSMNDLSMLLAVTNRIVVGNAEPALFDATAGRAFHSRREFAAGLRDGLGGLGVLP